DGKPLTTAELAPKAAPVSLDPAQFASHTDSSRVLFQGNPVGTSVATVRRTGDSLVYTEQSSLGAGAFQQTVTLVLAPADGSGRRRTWSCRPVRSRHTTSPLQGRVCRS